MGGEGDQDRDAATARPAVSIAEIGRVLEESARLLRQHAGAPVRGPAPGSGGGGGISAATVRSIIRLRRLRRDYFPAVPGDPAWSMMLELYASRLEGRTISQTKLGAAAGVSQTTALRLIRGLVDEGALVVRPSPADRRLLLVALSDETADRMRAWLALALDSAAA